MKLLFVLAALAFAESTDRQTVIVVIGAAGNAEYEKQFETWADRWAVAADKAGATLVRIGPPGQRQVPDRDRLQKRLAEESNQTGETLWLVLIGHGTFDGHEAKFNLRGSDFSAKELADWLKPIKRPLAVINCASSSGPFINRLSGPGRVVVTATKSGSEQNFARFGDYLSAAITDPKADLDKDDQTSLLEAYLSASARVAEFYAQESRLATEHALLDDNGDGLATPATWFRGVRAIRKPAVSPAISGGDRGGAKVDGLRANQFHLIRSQREARLPADVRARRDQLEHNIAQLRERKDDWKEDAYYYQLRSLLLELARLYEEFDKSHPEG